MNFSKFLTYQKTIMWVGLAFLVLIFVFVVRDNSQTYRLRQKAEQLSDENTKLETQIAELNNKVAYYNTVEYKQKIAREVLGLQAPGESVIIVPKKDTSSSAQASSSTQSQPKEPPKSNFRAWMDFLFGS